MLQFEQQYRMKRTPLSDDELNRRWRHIDVRLHGLEEKIGRFDASVDALVERGLARINTELSAAIDDINAEVDNVQALVAGIETLVADLERQIEDIVTGGTLPATAITVSAIGGISAANAQAALAELRTQVAAIEGAVTGLGDVQVVADLSAAAVLTGLDVGDLVHVVDNGSSKWARYQITSAGDGTWSGATKVVIWTQDQAPATHQHVIADVTGLTAALSDINDDIAANAAGIATNAAGIATNSASLASLTAAVAHFAMSTPPTGWLKANGALVSRTTYADLFAAIGTTFGAGDGSTTFALPDLRGEFIRGWDDGRSVDTSRVFGSTQADGLKSHVHEYSVKYNLGGSASYTGEALAGSAKTAGPASFNAIPLQDSEATGDVETRPRNIALLACIKY